MEGLGRFSCDLYHKLGSDDNVFFSGYSISSALSLAYLGAKGETKEQMAKVLGYQLEAPQIVKALVDIGKSLNTDDGKVETLVGNSLWVQDGLELTDNFLKIASEVSELIRRVDYVNAPEDARGEINAWVAEKTRDMIKDLIPEGVITEITRLVLANAVYFNGKWHKSFDPKITKEAMFANLDGTTSNVELMYNNESEGLYSEGDDYQFVALPYGDILNTNAYMLIVLPKVDCFEKVNATISPSILHGMLNATRLESNIRLSLPKFKLKYKKDLAELLAEDMPYAFSDDNADFSGITGGKDLVISNIIHEAVVDVTEEGTEAAAATAVVMRMSATIMIPEKKIIVRVDRPFMFAIWDRKNDIPMFMGKVTKL